MMNKKEIRERIKRPKFGSQLKQLVESVKDEQTEAPDSRTSWVKGWQKFLKDVKERYPNAKIKKEYYTVPGKPLLAIKAFVGKKLVARYSAESKRGWIEIPRTKETGKPEFEWIAAQLEKGGDLHRIMSDQIGAGEEVRFFLRSVGSWIRKVNPQGYPRFNEALKDYTKSLFVLYGDSDESAASDLEDVILDTEH